MSLTASSKQFSGDFWLLPESAPSKKTEIAHLVSKGGSNPNEIDFNDTVVITHFDANTSKSTVEKITVKDVLDPSHVYQNAYSAKSKMDFLIQRAQATAQPSLVSREVEDYVKQITPAKTEAVEEDYCDSLSERERRRDHGCGK